MYLKKIRLRRAKFPQFTSFLACLARTSF